MGDFPPALEDTNLERRVITWLRVRAAGGAHIRLLWAGINAVTVSQRARIANEVLAPGTGLPEQARRLARRPLVPGSARLAVNGKSGEWTEIDDLLAAGSEVEAADPALAPRHPPAPHRSAHVYMVNAEAGEIRFGDGLRGCRPPEGATLSVTYDYSVGAAGNVEKGAIAGGPGLPLATRCA